MKNRVIPNEISEQVEVVLKEVEKLKEVFAKNQPTLDHKVTTEEKLHSLFYLDLLTNLVMESTKLEAHINITKEDFVYEITQHEKLTIEQAEKIILRNFMFKDFTGSL